MLVILLQRRLSHEEVHAMIVPLHSRFTGNWRFRDHLLKMTLLRVSRLLLLFLNLIVVHFPNLFIFFVLLLFLLLELSLLYNLRTDRITE